MSSTKITKKTGLVAALTAVICLSGAAIMNRYVSEDNNMISDEIQDGSKEYTSQGYSGFMFVNSAVTWDAANHFCRDRGMRLATMNEDWKRNKIRQISGNRAIWIGYRSHGSITDKNSYRWESGAPRHFAPWAPSEPNNINGEKCVELMANGLLNNHQCGSHRLPFVCDKSPFFHGYAMHGIEGDGYTFDEADQGCRMRYGTTLATLTKPEILEAVMGVFQAPHAWVGLRIPSGVAFNERNFQFMSGVARPALRWEPNEPNNHGGWERCVFVHPNGKLNDVNCNARSKWYMCDQYVGNMEARFSSFEVNAQRDPIKNWAMPGKMIAYEGRNKYRLTMNMMQWGVMQHWSNILHVGNENGIRTPAIWMFPGYSKRLHIRQARNGNGNDGCDPGSEVMVPMYHFFRVDVIANPGRFEVKYNNVVRCTRPITIQTPTQMQKVWISDPWSDRAPVQIRDLYFTVHR